MVSEDVQGEGEKKIQWEMPARRKHAQLSRSKTNHRAKNLQSQGVGEELKIWTHLGTTLDMKYCPGVKKN